MSRAYAIVWELRGSVHAGSLEVLDGRLALKARGCAAAVPLASIAQSTIERGPSARLKGLPVLAMSLVGGDVLRVASLEGAAALRELAALVSAPRALTAAS